METTILKKMKLSSVVMTAEQVSAYVTGNFVPLSASHTVTISGSVSLDGNLVEGSSEISPSSYNSAAFGGSKVHGSWSLGSGNGRAYGYVSHAEGSNSKTGCEIEGFIGNRPNKQMFGMNSHAEGSSTEVSGWSSHAEGGYVEVYSDFSHGEGYNNTVGSLSVVITNPESYELCGPMYVHDPDRVNDNNISLIINGNYSHAEGYDTHTYGTASHTEGFRSKAIDDYSFVWNGEYTEKHKYYNSNGDGTFNINPKDGVDGFYIGSQPLSRYLGKSSEEYTALEVFPTNKKIPSGTLDSYEGLSAVFEWDDSERYFLSSQNFTGLSYSIDVQPRSFITFHLQSHCLKNDSDVKIDWGDGEITLLSEDAVDLYENESSENWLNNNTCNIKITHTYQGRYLNRKNIIKIYGKKYFLLRHTRYEDDTTIPGDRNIISRCWDYDLPVADCVLNMSSLCFNSKRLLRVRCPYMSRFNVRNFIAAFYNCTNLKRFEFDNSIFSSIGTYAVNDMFLNCVNLEYTNFKLPCNVSLGRNGNGLSRVFYKCQSLCVDIGSLIPSNGFTATDLDFNSTFLSCEKLFGTVPAEQLWNSVNTRFYNTENAFYGCSEEILNQVPRSWTSNGGYLQRYDVNPVDQISTLHYIPRMNNILNVMSELDNSVSVLSAGVEGMTQCENYQYFTDGGSIVANPDYKMYSFFALNDFDVWTDSEQTIGFFMLGVYNELPLNNYTFTQQRYYSSKGNLPTIDNKMKVKRGQYLAISYYDHSIEKNLNFNIKTSGTATRFKKADPILPLDGKTINFKTENLSSVLSILITSLGGQVSFK